MNTLEILSIHRILTEENTRASEENKLIVDKAYSKTEKVEKNGHKSILRAFKTVL